MSRDFLGWAWDDTQNPPQRGAFFADYDRNAIYVCHYQDELPCSECKGKPIKIKLAKDHRMQERERIIKLLEDNTQTMTSPLDGTVMRSLRLSPSDLIALIKGEK